MRARHRRPYVLARLSVLLVALWFAGYTPAVAEASDAEAQAVFRFDIPAGPLDHALAALERIAGVAVTVSSSLRPTIQALNSPGLTGTFTADQALDRLLAGTGLSHRLAGANAYTIDVRALSENVDVHADFRDTDSASITATKTLTPLRDVPQSVTVITRTMISEQSMQSMADVVRYVPGVGMGQGEGNRERPILRGNSTTADFFVDGIRDDVQYFRDLYNVERVEALKGPNAMIFGRGGAGGVINRAMRHADWDTARELTLQTGSHNNRRMSVDLDQPVNGRFATRLTAMYENSDAYRNAVGIERYGFNPSFAYSLGTSTALRVNFERFHDDRTADRGI